MTVLLKTFDEWVNVCMMQNVVKYLFLNIFQKNVTFINSKARLHLRLDRISQDKIFDLDKKIPSLIQKSYKHL